MSMILTAKNLSKIYPPQRKVKRRTIAVDKVSFDLGKGEILGLLGPNGAGKSTIISMLMGVLTPTDGNITVFGKDFAKYRSQVLQDMAFASTYVRMPWRLTILENLRVYGLLYGLNKKIFQERVEKLLKQFGAWEQRHKIMTELSAGQITRVMLVKAFLSRPKIVLLDEPTASLDPEMSHLVREFVLEQQRKYNTSIIYTSHNMDEINEVCNRVVFLRQGKVVAEDTPENLAHSSKMCQVVFQVFQNDQRDQLQDLAKEMKKSVQVQGKTVTITIKEKNVAVLLKQVSQADIEYDQLNINKPTLEDYFLRMAK